MSGITSRNILSTTEVSAGYLYDIDEGTQSWRAGLSYQALYPIIDLAAQFGNREKTETGFGNYNAAFNGMNLRWKEVCVSPSS